MTMINSFHPPMTFNLVSLQARSIDPYLVTYMDEYAMLLKIKSDYSMLNKLVHDLLNIDPTRPEVFVALSVLWETKDERGALAYAEKVRYENRALGFVLFSIFTNIHIANNQSIRIDERHITGFIMKVLIKYAYAKRPE